MMTRLLHISTVGVVFALSILFNGPASWAKEEITMNRLPEEQNLLVDFGESPDAPEYPDIGIAVRVWPTEAKPGEPIFLAGAYSADGVLVTECQQNLAACVVLTVTQLGKHPVTTRLPLIQPIVVTSPPPPGDFGPYYREGAQFRLNLTEFFNLAATPTEYTVEASLGKFTSESYFFSVIKPLIEK